ncbi:MAG: reactive intermediate/imine deaminase [Candidatus Tectimicrobiota bacterium]|nr:MAG: reactive intermediate/imine deaminase [Candidatus Tectomicrobia bacterium]
MPKHRVVTEHAPAPVGPYAQAVVVDGWVFVSGQVPLDPATGQWVKGDIRAQAERALRNLQAVLAAAGARLEDVVKTTVYLADLEEFSAFNEVYARFFAGDCPPARATVEVRRLPGDGKVEIEAVARLGAGP